MEVRRSRKTEYVYKFTTTDPNGDDVTYCIDWNDGTSEVYEGSLDEFDLNTLPALLSGESDDWNFAIEF